MLQSQTNAKAQTREPKHVRSKEHTKPAVAVEIHEGACARGCCGLSDAPISSHVIEPWSSVGIKQQQSVSRAGAANESAATITAITAKPRWASVIEIRYTGSNNKTTSELVIYRRTSSANRYMQRSKCSRRKQYAKCQFTPIQGA
jgi:hypothetical protein